MNFRHLLFSCCALAATLHAFVSIDYVTVGDIGNANDSTGYGGVAYGYQIGKYEVTNAQYVEMLNAKAATDTNDLYNTNMGSDAQGGITRSGDSGSYTYAVKSGYENKPVVFVSHLDAQRFANWIHNGQGTGSTETGAYTVGETALHASNASVWIPTQNEWYKAAYYQPTAAGGPSSSYWLYPTRSNTQPTSATSPSTITGAANYYREIGFKVGYFAVTQSGDYDPDLIYLTDVGSYTNSSSYYGTFDQGGNAMEWNDYLDPGGLIGDLFSGGGGRVRRVVPGT